MLPADKSNKNILASILYVTILRLKVMKLARRAILKAGFYLKKLKRPSFTTVIKGM